MLWVLLWDGFKSDWNGSLKPLRCVKDTLQNSRRNQQGGTIYESGEHNTLIEERQQKPKLRNMIRCNCVQPNPSLRTLPGEFWSALRCITNHQTNHSNPGVSGSLRWNLWKVRVKPAIHATNSIVVSSCRELLWRSGWVMQCAVYMQKLWLTNNHDPSPSDF